MSSSNKRNFKRRRNGRSYSVFNIWNRDKHRGESDDGGVNVMGLSALGSTSYNYQKYGFGQKDFEVKEENGLSSSLSCSKLTKDIDDDDDQYDDEISSPLPLSLLPSPTSISHCISNTSVPHHHPVEEEESLVVLPLLPLVEISLPSVAQLIRLLSLILRVTCISHYCSKLFSLFALPHHQRYHDASRSSKEETKTGWRRTLQVRSPPSSSAGGSSGNGGGGIIESSIFLAPNYNSSNSASKSKSRRSSRTSSGTFQRVRCQISSVRSDFIYIIVFTLCVLSPAVTPVITSNEVFPMDAAAVASDRVEAEISVPVEGVVGKRVDMPCDITPSRRDDSVYMVLWFRGDESIPIYSYDSRGRHQNTAKHWAASVPFGKRGHFQITSEPARLIVEPVKIEDQGIYRCRVDFRNSPSREIRLNLSITVPPQDPQIYENTGMSVRGEVGPYREGSTVELTCIVREGKPPPILLWYLNGEILDSSYHVENENQVINHITVPNIQRSQHRGELECRASNTLLIPPVSKTVIIELNLRPLSVSILQRHSQLETDTQYEITCESWGSHPAPSIIWYLGDSELKGVTTKQESRSLNTTVSRLNFIPTPDVDGQRLICRTANPLLIGSAIEDSWPLTIVYSPILSLRMGSSLNPNAIKEGDDVYFECLIKANPPTYKLSWYLNGQLLQHNQSAGVILSNQSLALQKVSRPSAGNYSCRAINQQGEGTSNEVKLEIMYAPACQNELSSAEGAVIIAASRSENINITCEMNALPTSLRFHWSHVNTVGETTELEPEIYSSQGSKSFLFYNLGSEEDFGTLLCWAQNGIGTSEKPCVFQLVPADCPQPVENCSIINRTSTSVEITCEPGFDGGLPQSFYLEAFQAAPPERRGLQFNISSSTPTFSLTGLDADGTFHFKIYSVNRKGKSNPSIMDGIALHYPAMQSDPVKSVYKHAQPKVRDLEKTTIAIIIGAVSAVFLSIASLIIFVVHRLRNPITTELEKSYSREFRPSRRSSTNDELYHHHNSKKPTNTTMDIPFTAPSELDEDGDPDLIPSKNVKTAMGMGKTYSRLSNGEINQRYGAGPMEKIPLRSVEPDVPLTMEQHSALSNYATFRSKPNGLGLKHRQLPPRPIVSSTSGSFHGKPSSVVVNIDTRLIGQQLASNQLPESCV